MSCKWLELDQPLGSQHEYLYFSTGAQSLLAAVKLEQKKWERSQQELKKMVLETAEKITISFICTIVLRQQKSICCYEKSRATLLQYTLYASIVNLE